MLTEDRRQALIYKASCSMECVRRRYAWLLERVAAGHIKADYLRWISMYGKRKRKLQLRLNKLSCPYERKKSIENVTWLCEKLPMIALADYWSTSCNDVLDWMKRGAPAWRRGQIHMLRERLAGLPRIDVDALRRMRQ